MQHIFGTVFAISQVGYQDCTQLMLMTQESQDDLNTRLDFKANFDRFRPNIIASNVKPYDEVCAKNLDDISR